MLKHTIRRAVENLGFDVIRVPPSLRNGSAHRSPAAPEPPPRDPVWPLPRHAGGPSDEEIRAEFARHAQWHYAYRFEGGLDFPIRRADPNVLSDSPERPLQRFRHFMPYLLAAQGGTLEGKRVLDIACNSGFWSIQCALLGAEVVGFDARPELVEQANLIRSIVGAERAEFRLLDFWDMRPETLGGTFDVVLNLGILYHLPKPLEALELTRAMSRNCVLLDTETYPTRSPLVRVKWEEPVDVRHASTAGLITVPSKSAVEMMLRHAGFTEWSEIPVHTADMPPDYLDDRRASWLVRI